MHMECGYESVYARLSWSIIILQLCTANEVSPEVKQLEQFGAQLGNVFANLTTMVKAYVDPEAMQKYANQFIDNAKNFVENQKKNQPQN